MSNEEILELFNVGDTVIITNRPSTWSSYCGGDYPLSIGIKYPYKTKIIKIEEHKDTGHISMFDGKYGWSFSSLINNNKIDLKNIKTIIRKKKLKKLNEGRGSHY